MFPTLSFGNHEIDCAGSGRASRQGSRILARHRITDGDTFAIMLRNDPALVGIMLAARQHAYFVPLNWHFTAGEAGCILRDSGAKALIVGGDLLQAIAAASRPTCQCIVQPLAAQGAADCGAIHLIRACGQ
jgi:long-chain acyl-CoA synthetase